MKEYKETYNSFAYKNNSELALYSAGHEICKPNQGYGPRLRPYHMIHFILEGEGTLQINKNFFSLQAGDIFLIPADKISYYEAAEKNPWEYYWVNFLGIQSENYLRQFMAASKEKYILHLPEVEKYTKIISEILNLEGSPTYLYLMGNSLLLRILSYLIHDINFSAKIFEKTSLTDDLRFFLDMHYAEKFQLRDVANNLGFEDAFAFSKKFHEVYKISPTKYREQK